MRKSTHLIVATIALLAIGFTGAYSTMSQKPLDKQWVELFKSKSDVITKYAETHPIHISDQVIDHQDMSDSTIPNAIFTNTEWINGSTAIDSHFINVKFIGGSMTNTGLSRSTFTNVIFESMTFNNVEFIGSTFINTTFKNCKIYNSELHNLKPSTFTIENSELNKVNFFESTMDLTLKNTRIIEEGMFGGLKAGSKITLDHSYIGPYSDFSSQKGLASFTAKNSELKRFALGGKIHDVTLDSSKLDFSIGFSEINNVIVRNSEMPRLAAGHGAIQSISISDCKKSELMDLREATVGVLNIRNCNIEKVILFSSIIGNANLTSSTFNELDASQTKSKELTLHGVTINNNGDFEGAIADKTSITDMTIAPTATLNMSGSNIPLKR